MNPFRLKKTLSKVFMLQKNLQRTIFETFQFTVYSGMEVVAILKLRTVLTTQATQLCFTCRLYLKNNHVF